MNIAIIGASNSIIGEKGYLLALRRSHVVTNLSGGDIPIAFTISKLLQHEDKIAGADWVILDHSISDRAVYYPRLGQEYLDLIDEAYQLAAQINPNVISLVFPMLRDTDSDRNYLAALTGISQKHGVVMADFQGLVTDWRSFEDPLHVHCEASFLIGEFLEDVVPDLKRSSDRDSVSSTPYLSIAGAVAASDRPVHQFESSLSSADYIQIDSPIELAFEQMQRLTYIEYIVLRGEARYLACAINGAANFFGGLDITGDVIMAAPSKRFVLGPVDEDVPLTMTHSNKHSVPGPFAHMNLSSILFREERATFPEPTSDGRERAEIDFSPLLAALQVLGDSAWYDEVQSMSDAAATLIAELNGRGLAQHKRYFGPTFDGGAKIRNERIDRYLNFRAS